MWWWYMPLISGGRDRWVSVCMSSRSALSTERVPGQQAQLHKKNLSQKNNFSLEKKKDLGHKLFFCHFLFAVKMPFYIY